MNLRLSDLIAFVAILVTGVALRALDTPPEGIATTAVALGGLYASWHNRGRSE